MYALIVLIYLKTGQVQLLPQVPIYQIAESCQMAGQRAVEALSKYPEVDHVAVGCAQAVPMAAEQKATQ